MIGNTERIYRMLNEYTDRYESVQDYINCHRWIDRMTENTIDLRSQEKLLEMPKQNFIALMSNLFVVGPGGYRLYEILLQNTYEEIRDAIFVLLYGEGELEDRIIMARKPGIGISFISQMLCFYDPKQYSIKDRITKIGICEILGYGTIIPSHLLDDEKGASPYDDMSYTEFHKLVTEVGKHFILKMLQMAGEEKEHLGKFINSRKYLMIDQFLRFCYTKAG